jgi:hypothetical protein
MRPGTHVARRFGWLGTLHLQTRSASSMLAQAKAHQSARKVTVNADLMMLEQLRVV